MPDDHEQRITELEGDMLALHSGLEDFYTRLEACAEVLALVVQRTTLGGEAAIDLAKALDRLIETKRMLTTQGEKAGTAWLVRMRDDLVMWHHLEPAVVRAITEGKLRPTGPKERLKLVADDGSPDSGKPPPEASS